MANTRETMGEQACLDALVADTLTSFEDDGVTKIGGNALQRHEALISVKLPQCKSISNAGFYSCKNLEVVDMQGTAALSSSVFSSCNKLAHLILRGSSMTTINGTNNFAGTLIEAGYGAVYVPSDLLAAYKANSKWKSYFITTLDKYPLSEFSTIEDDWATIISKAEAGTASESYSIGDTKMIDLGTEGKVYAQIAGFGVDPLASDGTKTAGITFVARGLLATTYRMNPKSTGTQGTGANGGWEHSEMRTYLNNAILPLFPSQLQTAIKSVTKYSDYVVPGESSITHDLETQDKLWIPSTREVFGGTSYEQTGPIYTNLFNSNSRRIMYNESGSAGSWWMRSARAATSFRSISSTGTSSQDNAYSTNGVVLGFCI